MAKKKENTCEEEGGGSSGLTMSTRKKKEEDAWHNNMKLLLENTDGKFVPSETSSKRDGGGCTVSKRCIVKVGVSRFAS